MYVCMFVCLYIYMYIYIYIYIYIHRAGQWALLARWWIFISVRYHRWIGEVRTPLCPPIVQTLTSTKPLAYEPSRHARGAVQRQYRDWHLTCLRVGLELHVSLLVMVWWLLLAWAFCVAPFPYPDPTLFFNKLCHNCLEPETDGGE